ncbi:alpha-galactosidase [Weizmannia acidilactici]|uniref:alpha-galactosidase n=1 Tax=Weizmannia acidilactici TaxID=2607726 RepID=UPI00124E753F|nr:alpha-galactosidase [Weizmannia acidilactici]GER73661.1 alpha-galactosidase [Weizmannia acidilactici]
MPIFINEENKEFHLQTQHTSYIFHVMKNKQLGQLYYGKRINHRESFGHLFEPRFRPNVVNVYPDDQHFSLTTLKQEYPAYGTGDFRYPAYMVKQANGSRITNFEYKGYRLIKGKPKLEGLPATYVESSEEAETLDILLTDELLQVDLHLFYTVFDQYNAITRSVKFFNRGAQTIELPVAMSMSIDLPDAEYVMMQLSGSWARERHLYERKLQPGVQSISSTRAASSAQQNPFFALRRPDTTEDFGEVYGFSLVYSGNFLAQVEVDDYHVSRVTMGINPFDFNWRLDPGQAFQTPEAVMIFSSCGLTGMSQTFHKFYRERLARGKWRDVERPVLINNWEGTYFDFNEDKIVSIAEEAKKLGVELFVLDDGWFGKRDDDTTSLGDWFVDKRKLPNGLKGLSERIRGLGLKFGLWFEPEMVSIGSELYQAHPDWVIRTPGRRMSPGRNQYVLDFSRDEVVDYLYERISSAIEEGSLSYIKWDMNRHMSEIYSAGSGPERQQETAHRYILGVYRLYDRLTSDYPDVLFESCASGGGRFDPGILYYAPQTWTSDDTDAVERLKIQYGTSFVYPLSSMGAHVSAVPNHQVGRFTPLETRAAVAYFGTFGYELDVTKMSDEEKQAVKNQIAFYKENRKLLQFGNFYRIESPFEGDGNVTSWMVVSPDQKEAVAARYQVLAKPNPAWERLYFKGLAPDKQYRLEGSGKVFYGDELMYAGLLLDDLVPQQGKSGQYLDFNAVIFKLSMVEE